MSGNYGGKRFLLIAITVSYRQINLENSDKPSEDIDGIFILFKNFGNWELLWNAVRALAVVSVGTSPWASKCLGAILMQNKMRSLLSSAKVRFTCLLFWASQQTKIKRLKNVAKDERWYEIETETWKNWQIQGYELKFNSTSTQVSSWINFFVKKQLAKYI